MKYLKFLPFLSLMVMFIFSHHQVSAQKYLSVPEAITKVNTVISDLQSQIGNSNNKGQKAFANSPSSPSNRPLNLLKIKYGNYLVFLMKSGKGVQETLNLTSTTFIKSGSYTEEETEVVETFYDKLLTN